MIILELIHAATVIKEITEYKDFITKLGKNHPFVYLPNDKVLIEVTDKILSDFPELATKPYWFKVNCFYDIATNNDVLILEYGDTTKNPIVRIHSESLLNRFPLTEQENKEKYK